MTSTAPFKLLFLGAGPEDMPRIRQDREYKKIRQRLARSRHGDRVIVADEQAVSASELSEHLLEHNPHIVHISTHGYGASTDQLAFEDSEGLAQPVSTAQLSDLFAEYADQVRCVVLSACFSQVQASAMAEHIDCVIGVSGQLEDRVAIRFARHFYGALATGKRRWAPSWARAIPG